MDKGGDRIFNPTDKSVACSIISPVMNKNDHYTADTLTGKANFHNPISHGGYPDPGTCSGGNEYFPVSET